MAIELPPKWSREVPTQPGWYWAERRGAHLFRRYIGGPECIQAYPPGSERGVLFAVPGFEDGVDSLRIRDLFQAFCPVEAAPVCDVPLKT